MGYRDEGEAALHRVASLEQDLAEERARAEEEAGQVAVLQEKLAQANAEIVRLRGNPIASPERAAPIPVENTWIVRGLLGMAVASLVPLALAANESERAGMAAAYAVVPLWGAFAGAWARRHRPLRVAIVAALVGGVAALTLLFVFFAAVWSSL